MSFLCNHSEIGSIVLVPVITYATSIPFVSVTSVNANPGHVAPEGKMMFFIIGGIATGTVSNITIAGFTEIALGSPLRRLFYKVAGPSEPSTYLINFIGGGTLGGHYRYVEADYINFPLDITYNAHGDGRNAPTPGTLMQLTNGTYNVLNPSLAMASGTPNTSLSGIDVDNSFGPGTGSQSGAFKAWTRVYNVQAIGEMTNAFHPTLSATITGRMTIVTGKRMF